MIEVTAIFVACQINFLICVDLPFLKDKHTFENQNQCRIFVEHIVKIESSLRKKNNNLFPVVMGRCRPYLNERSDATIF